MLYNLYSIYQYADLNETVMTFEIYDCISDISFSISERQEGIKNLKSSHRPDRICSVTKI